MIVNLTDDATGRKLKKVHDGVNHFYIDGIEYSDDNLLFIATEEGRVRKHETTGSWVYDYFLKDHLGNVRVVLTAAPPTIDAYPAATMETLEAAAEETFYANLPETRMDKPSGFDGYTDANPLNLKVAELGALSGKKVGPSITLKVNAGDKLTLSAKSFYNSQASYSRDQLLPEMLLMLLDGLMNPTGLTGQTGTVAREAANYQVFGSSNSYSSALSSIANNVYNNTEAKPKAFMVWMLFDNEFNLVKSSSGMLQVGEAGSPAKNMVQDNLVMERGGYFYAYLVNESPTSVYFDDFKVTHSAGKVLEENHYYPFGMLNAQLSTQPIDKPLNYYKYNGKELQKELNLEWLDYGARFYDAQVGRWHAIDPLAEVSRRWSPYTYGYNSPTTVIDPDGMQAQSFMDLFNQSGDGLTDWNRNDDGSYSRSNDNDTYTSSPVETVNSDNPPITNNAVSTPSNQGNSVGQPGTWEGLIPVWGSGRSAVDHFQNGNYLTGFGYSALAISDLFLVKSITTAVGRGAWKVGAHSWSATRQWLGKTGYAKAGQPVHHWAVSQATAKKYGLEAVTNQPWNLMTFSNQGLHMRAGHGTTYLREPGYGVLGKLWYGTPIWPKTIIGSYGGRIVSE